MTKYILVIILPLFLAGCNVFSSDVSRGYQQNGSWTTAATYTTADVRIITERKHPVLGNTVVCTEPSPDVAKALTTALQLQANGGNGAVNAGVSASGGSAEAALELAGRSTALLGLRDGLFQACQAFANGAIGADAYALILSHYGQLMTTLFLGQDVVGASGPSAGGTVQSPTINLNSPTSAGTQSNPKSNTGGTTPTPPAAGQGTTSMNPAPRNAANGAKTSPLFMLASATQLAQNAAPSPAGKQAPANPPPANPPPANPPPANSPQANQQPGNAAPTATVNSNANSGAGAFALARMNEDYLHLDFDLAHLILVACVNEKDPTRLHAPAAASQSDGTGVQDNSWLTPLCMGDAAGSSGSKAAGAANVANALATLEKMNAQEVVFQNELPFVDPTAQAAQKTSTQAPASKTAAATSAQITPAQKALAAAGIDPGPIDGKMGPRTAAAITNYQVKNKLPVTGVLDAATMKALKIQ